MLSDILANPKKYIKEYDDHFIKLGEEKRTVEIVKKMLLDGEPISKIIKYSGLTEKEIKDILNNL